MNIRGLSQKNFGDIKSFNDFFCPPFFRNVLCVCVYEMTRDFFHINDDVLKKMDVTSILEYVYVVSVPPTALM